MSWFKNLFCRPISGGEIVYPDFSGTNRRGVFVGLTKVIPHYYSGWPGACPGCDLDETRWMQQAGRAGVPGVLALDLQGTRANAVEMIRRAADGLKRDDLLVLDYSGHGGQRPDQNGDEADGKDEYFCLADGPVDDDLVYDMLCGLPEGLRVFMGTDCCNSQTIARSVPMANAIRVAVVDGHLPIQLIHMAACADGQSAFGGDRGGVFTNARLAAYKRGISYFEFCESVMKLAPANQRFYYTGYNVTRNFWNTEVFN